MVPTPRKDRSEFVTMKKAITIISFLVSLAISQCAHAQAEKPYPVNKLVVGTTMTVKSVGLSDYYFGVMRGMLTHSGLVALDENGEFYGDLAESWKTDHGKTWTFVLRKGVSWHDGRPVLASDVRFSFQYLLEKVPVYKSHFGLVETVEAPDDHTVIVTLSEPYARLPVNLLVLRIIPRHCFENVDSPETFVGPEAAVGSGPYVFDHFDRSAGRIGFKAFPGYFRGAPNVESIVFRSFRNPDVMYMAFRKGEIDIPYFYAAGTPPFQVPLLSRDPEIAIHRIENPGVPNAIFFNTRQPPLDRREFRCALSLAIDYEEIVRFFSGGFGSVPNGGFVPRGNPEFVETEPLKHDPARASEILEGMGYTDSDKDGCREREGKRLEVELVARTDVPGALRLTELLKEYFGKVGVTLTLRPVDLALFSTICDQERSHRALLSRATPWGMTMWAGCGTGYFDSGNIGWSMVDDERFSAIVARMNTALDRDEYLRAAADVQRYYSEELPAVPLYWDVLIQPARKRFTGWKTSPMYGFLWEKTWFSLRENEK